MENSTALSCQHQRGVPAALWTRFFVAMTFDRLLESLVTCPPPWQTSVDFLFFVTNFVLPHMRGAQDLRGSSRPSQLSDYASHAVLKSRERNLGWGPASGVCRHLRPVSLHLSLAPQQKRSIFCTATRSCIRKPQSGRETTRAHDTLHEREPH